MSQIDLFLISVLREYSNVNKCKTELRSSAERLRINADFYLKSLSTDLESLTRLTSGSLHVLGVHDALREWNQDKADVESFARLRDTTAQLERKVSQYGRREMDEKQGRIRGTRCA